jgi:hypothetical protein
MQLKINGWQLSTIVLGSLFLGSLSSQGLLSSKAEAAPADVKGSPNVAVDTYRNSAGTYILWSNGKITNADGDATDLGHPYTTPDAAAKIGKQTLEPKKLLGSPNVAIKAIPRKDATYILFADGTLQKPASSAAYAGEGGSRVIAGSMGTSGIVDNGHGPVDLGEVGQEYAFETGIDGGYGLRLQNPVGPKSEAFLLVAVDVGGTGVQGLQGVTAKSVMCVKGVISADGLRVSFPGNYMLAPGGPGTSSGSPSHFTIYDKS